MVRDVAEGWKSRGLPSDVSDGGKRLFMVAVITENMSVNWNTLYR